MKTTIEIDDGLFERAKLEAVRRKTTLRAIVDRALRRELGEAPTKKRFRLRDASFKGGGGLLPGVGPHNWFELSERPWPPTH